MIAKMRENGGLLLGCIILYYSNKTASMRIIFPQCAFKRLQDFPKKQCTDSYKHNPSQSSLMTPSKCVAACLFAETLLFARVFLCHYYFPVFGTFIGISSGSGCVANNSMQGVKSGLVT